MDQTSRRVVSGAAQAEWDPDKGELRLLLKSKSNLDDAVEFDDDNFY